MNPEESNAKLRRLVPWLGGAILAVVLGGGALALFAPKEDGKVTVVIELSLIHI